MGLGRDRESARLAGAADDAAGGARERDDPLPLAAAGAGAELGREPRRQSQLQPEGEPDRVPVRPEAGDGILAGPAVEQRQVAAEQVVGGPVRLGRVEQPQDRVAAPRRGPDRDAVGAQARVAVDRRGAGHGAEVAAPLVQHQVEAEERLEAPAEPRLRPPRALRDRVHPPALGRVQVEDPVGLAVADAPQHDSFCLEASGHDYPRRRMTTGAAARTGFSCRRPA